ncbi:unnamed protein product [Arctogadus glacialis]
MKQYNGVPLTVRAATVTPPDMSCPSVRCSRLTEMLVARRRPIENIQLVTAQIDTQQRRAHAAEQMAPEAAGGGGMNREPGRGSSPEACSASWGSGQEDPRR